MKYLLRFLVLSALFMVAATGCKKKEEKPVGEAAAPHGMGVKKNLPVVVPGSVKGKWKAVKIAVTEKSSNKSIEYTVPLGSEFKVPNTGLVVEVVAFLPQFTMNGDSLTSVSNDPKNPAAQASRPRAMESQGSVELQAGNLVRVGSLIPGQPGSASARRRGPGAAGSLRPRSGTEAAQAAVARRGSTRRRTSPGGARSVGIPKPFSDATGLAAGSKALEPVVGASARATAGALVATARRHRPGQPGTAPRRGANP
jgi:hypothetical protein